MKKASLIAGAIVALAATSAPVFAQGGPFADVPTDHWAYAAVDKLQKRGIVIGYPDGTYGGKRNMSRYEFAIAIARMLDLIDSSVRGPQIQTDQFATKTDLNNYALKSDLAGLARAEDVATLRRLVGEFQTELTALGVDIDAVKKRLDALEGRVTAIEDELRRMVRVTGTFNTYSRSNNRFKTDTNVPGIGPRSTVSVRDANGFEVTGGQGSRGGLLADTRVFHDLDLNIRARVTDKTTFDSTINFGNYLSFLNSISSFSGVRSDRGPSRNGVFAGQQANQDQTQTVYKALLDSSVRFPGLGVVGLTVGRIPMQMTEYTLKLIDVDYYFDNYKTDSGNIPLDGIRGRANVGPFGVTAFAAKVDPVRFVSNSSNTFPTDINYGLYAGASRGGYGGPLRAQSTATIAPDGFGVRTGNRPVGSPIAPNRNGAIAVEQMAGVRAEIGNRKVARFGGTFMYMSGSANEQPIPGARPNSNADIRSFDRVAVLGADFEGKLGPIGVLAAYTVTDTYGVRADRNGNVSGDIESKVTDANDALDVAGKYEQGATYIRAGYREIAPYFGAPGFWGRVGSLYNPTDIEGFYGEGSYRFSRFASLVGAVHLYKGTGDARGNGGLSPDDEINNWHVGIRYGLTSASNVDLGYETTEYDVLNAAGTGRIKPREEWINIGFGYMFNPASSFKLGYQFINYDDKNSGFDTLNGDGGVLTTAFTVRF